MPKINLKQLAASGKSVVAQASGQLENALGASGQGAFSVSAGPNGVSISANFNELIKNVKRSNRMVSPLKELYKNNKVEPSIIFPPDIDNEHYIIFSVMRYDRAQRTDKAKRNYKKHIVLPVPSNLGVTYSANYANENLGIFGAAAAGQITANELKQAGSSIADMVSSKIDAGMQAFKSGDTDAGVQVLGALGPTALVGAATSLAGGIGGLLALGGTSGGVASGLSVNEGISLNPHMAVVFNGVGFRTHSFTYNFIARNQQESDLIKEIIDSFSYHMLPSYTAGTLAFQYPDEFYIEFAEGIRKYLFEYEICVLQSVQVNYNGQGTPLFFENTQAPVNISISLQFQETAIKTKESMEKNNISKRQDVVSRYEGYN
jgi:hypothetical protein